MISSAKSVDLVADDLGHEPTAAAAYLAVLLAQIESQSPWVFAPVDPIGDLLRINDLRARLEREGHTVPQMADPNLDPLRNMKEWRAFLTTIVTVN
jgi:hypothetical protein